MKNLKKLSKNQLKGIKGAGGIKSFPDEPDFCMYVCGDIIVCAACSKDFECPVTDMQTAKKL